MLAHDLLRFSGVYASRPREGKTMKRNPIETTKSSRPWWMTQIHCFNGLGIHPCCIESIQWHLSFYKQCGADSAEFWSVYGHHVTEEWIDFFEGFPSPESAREFAEKLLSSYPHLHEFGLLDCSYSQEFDFLLEKYK